MYELTDEYLTGIELVDNEHKKLFEIADRAYYLLKDQFVPDKYDSILEIILELKNYTKKHFADEEEYMASINYKRMFTQKIEHDAFIAKLEEVNLDTMDENQSQTLLDLVDFLSNWLFHHILENDKLIGK